MFCPDCGLEDKQANQFCRACGIDLRPIRYAVTQPTDTITASAASARSEIGRAIAAKIRDSRNPEDLAVVAEDVLPELEKFLESPEEKRLRRIRTGVIMSSIGLGTAVAISASAVLSKEEDMFFLAGLGFILFFIGLGFILNGMVLTVPKRDVPDRSPDADRQRQLDSRPTNDLFLPEPSASFPSSVTENTTRHLKQKDPIVRE